MADIAKCQGENCDRRQDCYRYTAPASEWQAWLETPTERPCPMFWGEPQRALMAQLEDIVLGNWHA